ncbi:MAG: PTS sugar transporter subunit IIA [Lentisphaerae bacterium]|nr:PTS sugar transporter subunit IIA [Lentisphaerota bacterium]
MGKAAAQGKAKADGDEILTLSELAAYLKVSEKTILRMVQAGQFPGVKVSNQWRFVRAIVDDWLSVRMQWAPAGDVLDAAVRGLQVVPLTRLVSNRRIILNLQPGSREAVLAQLVAPLEQDGLIGDADGYVRRLAEREDVVSTAIGHGLAIPHVRDPEHAPVRTPCIVLAICREGTAFGALDGEKTCVFAMPCADGESAHLRLLARLALFFRRPGVLPAMRQARSRKAVLTLLAEADREMAERDLAGRPEARG